MDLILARAVLLREWRVEVPRLACQEGTPLRLPADTTTKPLHSPQPLPHDKCPDTAVPVVSRTIQCLIHQVVSNRRDKWVHETLLPSRLVGIISALDCTRKLQSRP